MLRYTPHWIASARLAMPTLILFSFPFALNHLFFHYTGNAYCPKEAPFMLLSLLLLYWGSCLSYGKKSPIAASILGFLAFFAVVLLIALMSTAVQYTPFK